MLELGIGLTRVVVEADGQDHGTATMDQPVPSFRPVEASPAELAGLLGLEARDLAPDLPPEFGSAGVEFLYLPLRSLAAVQRAQGQAEAARAFFGDHDHPAIFLFSLETAEAGSAAHGRMYSLTLGQGMHEDAATGGAAGPFGAYLVRHGARPAGRLIVEQGYEMGRYSQLEVTVEMDQGQIEAVRVGGGVVRLASARFEL
jgi:trans-2,3-dihydro-3-hydroxyanthranilate isomerase